MNGDFNKDVEWTTLTTVSEEQICKCEYYEDGLQPSCYVDVNGKEWIILLMPDADFETDRESTNDCDGYLYDVENDKLVSFIKSYEEDINQRFNIYKQDDNKSSRQIFKSYVIDNDNHIMYWYVFVCTKLNEYDTKVQAPESYSMLIAFDIKDLTNIQLLYQRIFKNNQFSQYSCGRLRGPHMYKMVMIDNNRIELVLGGVNGWSHYQFNTTTRKLKLIVDCILSKYINNVTYKKICHYFENLTIGDCIDTRYLKGNGNFHLSQIVDIKDKKFNQQNELISMKIKIHYQGWSTDQDEWIDVFNSKDKGKEDKDCLKDDDHDNNELSLTSLCDCNEKCRVLSKKYHRIALPKCQSYYHYCKYSNGWNAIYSKREKKLMVFGRSYSCSLTWSGLYCTRYHDYQLIVDGFIHHFEKNIRFGDCCYSHSYSYHYNIIPNDLKQLIFKYYYISDNDEWTQAGKIDKSGEYMQNRYKHHFLSKMGSVIVNDDNDIFIFGGNIKMSKISRRQKYKGRKKHKKKKLAILRMNVVTGDIQGLKDIKYPIIDGGSYAVFCNKSQSIHLFARNFGQHLSIPLKSLNNASTVLIDN